MWARITLSEIPWISNFRVDVDFQVPVMALVAFPLLFHLVEGLFGISLFTLAGVMLF